MSNFVFSTRTISNPDQSRWFRVRNIEGYGFELNEIGDDTETETFILGFHRLKDATEYVETL